MIKNLKDIKLTEIDMFGGKACNLGHLIQNSFNVPPGFCVSVDEGDLSHALALLPGNSFAVRSSATAEDSKNASFAGQHDTYLNVHRIDVPKCVEKCRASLNTERAVAYREAKGIKESKMAVIVQVMINAEWSGVMFTKDPIEKKYILIEAAPGLGESIVSGTITPSNFYIEDKIIKKQNNHDIDEDMVLIIAQLGKKIEKLYNAPQDIEFSVKGAIFILQTRPITA